MLVRLLMLLSAWVLLLIDPTILYRIKKATSFRCFQRLAQGITVHYQWEWLSIDKGVLLFTLGRSSVCAVYVVTFPGILKHVCSYTICLKIRGYIHFFMLCVCLNTGWAE